MPSWFSGALGLSQDYKGETVVSNPVAADRSIAFANRNYSEYLPS